MYPEKRFYNAKDLSVYLGVTEDAVRKWALRGQIPYVKLGKCLRFDMIRVNGWLKKKECAFFRKEFIADDSRDDGLEYNEAEGRLTNLARIL